MSESSRPPDSDMRLNNEAAAADNEVANTAVADTAVAGAAAVAVERPRGGGGVSEHAHRGAPIPPNDDDGGVDGGEEEDSRGNVTYLDPVFEGKWPDTEPGPSKPANFGIACGNWGGDRHNSDTQNYMLSDIRENPCHVICLQEAT